MALSHEGAEVDLTYRNSEDIPEWNSFCLFTVFLEIIAIPGLVSIHDGLLIVFIRFCIYTVCFIQIILRILFFPPFLITPVSPRNRSVRFCSFQRLCETLNRFFRSALASFLPEAAPAFSGASALHFRFPSVQIHILSNISGVIPDIFVSPYRFPSSCQTISACSPCTRSVRLAM